MSDEPTVRDLSLTPQRSLRRVVEAHVDQALQQVSADPGILWDLSYVPAGAEAQSAVTALLVFTAPSTVMGEFITLAAGIVPYKLTEFDMVLKIVRDMVEHIRTLRSQALKRQ